jgi:hypothetical protein
MSDEKKLTTPNRSGSRRSVRGSLNRPRGKPKSQKIRVTRRIKPEPPHPSSDWRQFNVALFEVSGWLARHASGEATACILSCHQDSGRPCHAATPKCGIPFQLGVMLNPARWLWFNPEEVVRIHSKHRFRPKGQIPNVGIWVEWETGKQSTNRRQVNRRASEALAADPVRCHLPFGKRSPLFAPFRPTISCS